MSRSKLLLFLSFLTSNVFGYSSECLDKKELASKSYNAMFSDKLCRIININPGYVETDMVAQHIGKFKMLQPNKVAETIKWCLDQPQDIEIGELSIWKTTLR